jgi:hypothetical protein
MNFVLLDGISYLDSEFARMERQTYPLQTYHLNKNGPVSTGPEFRNIS